MRAIIFLNRASYEPPFLWPERRSGRKSGLRYALGVLIMALPQRGKLA